MTGFPTKGVPMKGEWVSNNVEWTPDHVQKDVDMGGEQGIRCHREKGALTDSYPDHRPMQPAQTSDMEWEAEEADEWILLDQSPQVLPEAQLDDVRRPIGAIPSIMSNVYVYPFTGGNHRDEQVSSDAPYRRVPGEVPTSASNLGTFRFPGVNNGSSNTYDPSPTHQSGGKAFVASRNNDPFMVSGLAPNHALTPEQPRRRPIADIISSQAQASTFSLPPQESSSRKRAREFDEALPSPVDRDAKKAVLSSLFASEPPVAQGQIAGHFKTSGLTSSHGEFVSRFYGLLDADDADQGQRPSQNSTSGGFNFKPVVFKANPYVGLDFEDSIRILRLEPGTGPSLDCRLQTTRLSELGYSYEAISYVWGDTKNQIEVETPDGTFRITRNLSAALHRLRYADKPRYIWADAICINQDDDEEKGHQVRLMRSIYKRARSVLVWLGPDATRKSILAFSVICSIASGGTVNGTPMGQANFYSNGISSAHIPDLPCRDGPPNPSFKALWSAVQELFAIGWFWRVWCIQEVALASTATIIWGKSEIPWRWLGLAAARLRINFYNILQTYKMPGVYNTYLMYRISQGESDVDPLRFSFSRLLSLTRQFESTDPRDRIFGLLGIPTTDSDPDNGQFFMEPDYSLSAQEIYKILAQRVLSERDTLDLLSSVQHGDELDTSRPTWIPQWDKVYTTSLLPSEIRDGWSGASQGRPSILQMSGPHAIVIRGVHPFIVQKVMPKRISSSGPYLDDAIAEYEVLMRNDKIPGHDAGCPEALCWTLTAQKRWDGFEVSDKQEQLADFAAYIRTELPRYAPLVSQCLYNGDRQRFLQAASIACDGRRLFVTSSGHLGLGPPAMRDGDFICALFGAYMPFVLRPDGEHFWLVGECYMYSLMAGQAIEALGFGQLKDREFVLR